MHFCIGTKFENLKHANYLSFCYQRVNDVFCKLFDNDDRYTIWLTGSRTCFKVLTDIDFCIDF